MFKKNEFRAVMGLREMTVLQLAERLNINPSTLSKKINGHVDFSRDEVASIRRELNLSDSDVIRIFFA